MNMRWLCAPLLASSVACSSSIAPKGGNDDGESTTEDTGRITDDGTVELTVDATDMEKWAYLDLESARLVSPTTPSASRAWDVAFRRFAIATNGGVSGAGGVEAAVLTNVAFDDVTDVPESGFASDAADGDDDDTAPEYVMSTGDSGWYDYDPTSHTLTPRKHVYVIRTVERGVFKLEVRDYYNDAGTSGHFSLRFAQLAPGTRPGATDDDTTADAGAVSNASDDAGAVQSGEDANVPAAEDAGPSATFTTLTVDASSNEAWVRIDIGKVSVVHDVAASWDLAFQRTRIQTNSGTSGTGMGGAKRLEGDFDTTLEAPSLAGFEVDAMLPIPGPPGSGEFSGNPVLNAWYDYDPTTHTVSPKAEAYVVRTASGRYAKLRIAAYAGGVFTLDVGALGE
jgi:hypothetical protein